MPWRRNEASWNRGLGRSAAAFLTALVLLIPPGTALAMGPRSPPSPTGGLANRLNLATSSAPRYVVAASSDDWSTYGSTPERTGSNSGERAISPTDASALQVAWTAEVNRTILGSLIVVNDTVYVADRGGYLSAINATSGALLGPSSPEPWTTPFLGNTSYSRCGGGSPSQSKLTGAIATPTLLGNRLYESGGNTSFYVLSLGGQVLQRIDISNRSDTPWYFDYNWASPLVADGFAYLGTAALCEFNGGDPNHADWKYMQGQLVQVDLANGSIAHVFNVTNGSSTSDTGGSIWSTPAFDPTTNTIWFTTGNENSSSETPSSREYPRSMVAVNATTLQFRGACQVGSVGVDADYGAGPTLFNDSKGGRYVGAINKDGVFYAYNASDPSGGNCGAPGTGNLRFAWSDVFCASTTPGTISPAAFDGSYLYIASDGCSNDSGFVDQIYPSNGTIRWSHSMYSPSSEAHAGVTVADGLVVVAANQISAGTVGTGELQVLDANTGSLLFHHAFDEETNAWPVVAEGAIYVTSGNLTTTDPGFVTAFRVPLSVQLSVGNASCTGNPIADCVATSPVVSVSVATTGGVPPVTCSWNFGDGSSATGCSVSHTYLSGGGFVVDARATDAIGEVSTASFNLSVAVPFTAGALSAYPSPDLDVGQSVNVSIFPEGGFPPYSYSWTNLPLGCSPPTTSSFNCTPVAAGVWQTDVTVTDSNGSSATALPITVTVRNGVSGYLLATPGTLEVNQSLNLTAVFSGGLPPYTYIWQGLPYGCALGDLGAATCRPQSTGVDPVSVTVTDANGQSSTAQGGSVVVIPALATTISVANAEPEAGEMILISLEITGGQGPFEVSWSGLPGGCAQSATYSESCLFGTPGTPTIYATTIDALGAIAVTPLTTLNVTRGPVVSLTTRDTSITLGQSLDIVASAAGGQLPYALRWTGLPPGCTSTTAPTLSCTPNSTGAFSVEVELTDAVNVSSSAWENVTVTAGPVNPPDFLLLGEVVGAGILLAALLVAAVWIVGRRRRRPQRPIG